MIFRHKNKTAIITGVTGQLGSYFTEFLLSKGMRVIGGTRRLSSPNEKNISNIKSDKFIVEPMDLGDSHSIDSLIIKYKPDYFINCAANSFVGSSWDYPEQHFEFNSLGVLRQLESIRKHSPLTRYLNMGSSEEFGNVQFTPQNETHPAMARSPYGASKIAARQIVKVWRESYNLYALQCYCFNFESERRGIEFVSQKIVQGVARIKKAIDNKQEFEPIELGNLDARRDWNHALDTMDGIWRMLNQEVWRPDLQPELYQEGHYDRCLIRPLKEYILASGETHSVRSFVEKSFQAAGIYGGWQLGFRKEDETFESKLGTLVKINPKFYRPAEVELLCGDSFLAREELQWQPKYSFDDLVKEMTDSALCQNRN